MTEHRCAGLVVLHLLDALGWRVDDIAGHHPLFLVAFALLRAILRLEWRLLLPVLHARRLIGARRLVEPAESETPTLVPLAFVARTVWPNESAPALAFVVHPLA